MIFVSKCVFFSLVLVWSCTFR